jgi:putative FmdB family regulatory protein
MPIYEYACTACDHRVDILLGINDPGPHFCPSCGEAGTMRKLFAPPTIHYKGSGWAKKDRGSSGAGTKAAAKADAGKPADGAKDAPSTTTSSSSSAASDAGSSSSSSSSSPATD